MSTLAPVGNTASQNVNPNSGASAPVAPANNSPAVSKVDAIKAQLAAQNAPTAQPNKPEPGKLSNGKLNVVKGLNLSTPEEIEAAKKTREAQLAATF